MLKNKILHPFLFAIYPVLYLYSQNIANTLPSDIIIPFTISLGISFTLFLLFRLLTGDWNKAGIEASLILFLLFSYGHIFSYLFQQGILYNDHRPLAAIYTVVLIVGVWAIWRIVKKTDLITNMLNLIAIVLLIQPIFQIILYQTSSPSEYTTPPSLSITQTRNELTMPDIYYIVLDGYGRGDILEELYNYDNSEFLDFLEDKGFYIAHNGHTNYTQTIHSLSSTLTLNYLDQYNFDPQTETQNDNFLNNKIINNDVRQYLENQGYKTVSTASGWHPTQWKNATYYYSSPEAELSNFTNMYLMTTIILIFQKNFL